MRDPTSPSWTRTLQKELYTCSEDRGVTAELGQWLPADSFIKRDQGIQDLPEKLSQFASARSPFTFFRFVHKVM
jgi:hypothetical protein